MKKIINNKGSESHEQVVKPLNQFSRQELFNLIQSLIGDVNLLKSGKDLNNSIEVFGIRVSSNIEPLSNCKEVLDDVIKTHHNFILEKQRQQELKKSLNYI